MKKLQKRGLQNSNAVFNRKPMRLSFHKQRAVKRVVGIGGSQYRDIGNEFDAARIHFSPTPIGAGLFLRLTLSNPLPISRYWLRSFPRNPTKIPPAIS